MKSYTILKYSLYFQIEPEIENITSIYLNTTNKYLINKFTIFGIYETNKYYSRSLLQYNTNYNPNHTLLFLRKIDAIKQCFINLYYYND